MTERSKIFSGERIQHTRDPSAVRLGTFITFEGPDGSGKTTQMTILGDRLRSSGYEVVETQEPGGTTIGREIRAILLDSKNQTLCPVAEMLLYFAARSQNFDELIFPAWRRGAVVLSDRFTDSTLAYQGAGRGLGEGVVMQLHDLACHGLHPDLTICVDIDESTAIGRAHQRNRETRQRDRMDEQTAEFHSRVRQAYLRLAREHSDRIKMVDGTGDRTDVAERIWRLVKPVLSDKHRIVHV